MDEHGNTLPQKALYSTNGAHRRRCLELKVRVKGEWLNALVDSGAEQNYFDPTTANRLKLSWRHKQTPYSVVNLEGTPFDYNNGIIDAEIDHLKVFVEGKNQGISFDVVPNKQHDLVLGYPWLQQYNPHFDWRTGQVLSFNDETPSTTNDDSGYDTRSQTSTEEDGEARQRQTRDTSPPTGTRHKYHNGQKRQRQRMIARVMQQFHELEKNLEQPKKTHGNPEEEERLKNVPWKYRIYKKLFAEELETGLPEHTHYDLEIEFIDGKQPGFSKLYPLNEAQLPVLREYIEDMIRKGYIRESKSSVGYPVMFVPKKNGKLRLCVDFRMLNAITVKDRTPLPLISELKDRLFGMKYFTALDLKGAYNLIRIKEGHEWKTAFRTKYGLFEYLVMPFGLTNAPAAFQRMINNVLREHLDIFVVCYLDDILIFSKTEEEHTEHVHKVLQTLQDAKLLVEPEKSKFHASEVEFLGHIISHNEIRMDPKKVSAVRDWKEPTNVKEVQAFLGFANYYRKFLKAFGKIAAPLTELTKKDKTFVMGTQAKQAFRQIKELILSEPVLKMFDPSRPIELETDASDFALGAQIGQRDDEGFLHPIAFYSHKLHGAELNYPIYDKEFLAIVNAFKEFRHYLLGSKHQTKVYTDHKNITHFAKTQELSGRQLRYAEYLSEFDYIIIHVKGTENGRADAISRRPDLDTGKIRTKEQLLQLTQEGHLTQRTIACIQQRTLPYYLTDEWKNKIIANLTLGELRRLVTGRANWVGSQQGMITCQKRIFVPQKCVEDFIEHCHQTVKHDSKLNDEDFWKTIHEHFTWEDLSAGPNFADCKTCHYNQWPKPFPEHYEYDPITRTAYLTAGATYTVEQGNPLLGQIKDYNGQLPDDQKTDKQQVPDGLQHDLVREIHSHQLHGHQGINKTLERVKTTYTFPNMKKIVSTVIGQCDLCAKTKARRHKPYGKLQPLPVSQQPWDSITMDFITKLPLSEEPATGNFYDSILVIVDRLTKFSYFIPYRESTTAEEFAYLFYFHVAKIHGIPLEIITDRGPPFASKFWQSLTGYLGINHKLSTAYHKETDGQTERMNQTLEQYLRCYINYEQTNWVEKLPAAQLAYNTATNESTKITPAYANFGFTPDAYRQTRDTIINPKAILTSDQLKNLHEEMKTELEFVRNRMTNYANRKRIEGPIFSEGDMVYFATKNIETKRQNKKLDYKYIGPYKIKRKISENNYELDLPPKVKLHPIVHISLLESAENTIQVKTGNEPETEVDGPEEYIVENILDMDKINGKTMYFVKWKDYPDAENTWEPPEHLTGAQRLLKDFHQQRRKKEQKRRSSQ